MRVLVPARLATPRRSSRRAIVIAALLGSLPALLAPVAAQAGTIKFRAATSSHSSGTTVVALRRPEHVRAGDLMVGAIDVSRRTAVTAPDGWRLIRSDVSRTAPRLRQSVYVHFAGSAEPESYRWTLAARRAAAGGIAAYSGVNRVLPVVANGARTDIRKRRIVAPTLMAPVADVRLVAVLGAASRQSATVPKRMVRRFIGSFARRSTSRPMIQMSDRTVSESGRGGMRVAVAHPTSLGVGQALALLPMTATPPPGSLPGGSSIDDSPIPAPGPGGTPPSPPPPVAPASGIFNPQPLASTLNHTTFGAYANATQDCDLAGRSGLMAGTDHAISFVSGAITYHGCYSINENAATAPPPGGKRPAVFVFGPGTPRPASTSAEVNRAGNESLGIINQGKRAGWDMIYLGLFEFSDPTSAYDFTYDQVYADYTRAVVNDLTANRGTDPSRIYAYGSSTGGRAPTFVACHLSDKFAAVVAAGGAVHGPGVAANLAADRCSRPPNPVSMMYIYADHAQDPDGNPHETYAVHVTPTHLSLTSADVADVTTLPSSAQVYYSMQHVGEAWAFWNGCADNLVGRSSQTLTIGLGASSTPNSRMWQWTGCADKRGGGTGEVQLYIMPGGHGIERQVQDDGRAFRFLNSH